MIDNLLEKYIQTNKQNDIAIETNKLQTMRRLYHHSGHCIEPLHNFVLVQIHRAGAMAAQSFAGQVHNAIGRTDIGEIILKATLQIEGVCRS
jgi:hypothetical protein